MKKTYTNILGASLVEPMGPREFFYRDGHSMLHLQYLELNHLVAEEVCKYIHCSQCSTQPQGHSDRQMPG